MRPRGIPSVVFYEGTLHYGLTLRLSRVVGVRHGESETKLLPSRDHHGQPVCEATAEGANPHWPPSLILTKAPGPSAESGYPIRGLIAAHRRVATRPTAIPTP